MPQSARRGRRGACYPGVALIVFAVIGIALIITWIFVPIGIDIYLWIGIGMIVIGIITYIIGFILRLNGVDCPNWPNCTPIDWESKPKELQFNEDGILIIPEGGYHPNVWQDPRTNGVMAQFPNGEIRQIGRGK